MCEEVREPATQVPKAMVGTIVLNMICGFVFLVPLLFVMPDQATLAALASGQPVPPIIYNAIGQAGPTFALLIPLLVLGFFCGIGCTTAASRCTWAFARDGAIPGAKWWKVVNPTLDVPLNAMMLSMVVQILLGFIYFGSTAAFNAFSGVGVICLTLSYAVPIAVSLAGGRKLIAEGSFNMGVVGLVCNVIALCKFPLSVLFETCPNSLDRLVCPRYPALLYADCHPGNGRVHELRLSRLLRLLHHFDGVVLHLGQEELPGPAHARGRCSRGEESVSCFSSF
jgi:amino acid transporter